MNVLLYGAHGEPLVFAPPAVGGQIMLVDPDAPQPGVSCTGCGCTDDAACPEGCWWVGPALCSSCAELEDLEP